MTAFVFAVVLFAAALHASWNAIVKSAGDKLLTTVLVGTWAALLASVALPFLPQPDRVSWPFILASVLIHIIYFLLVARAYHVADMSQSYPLMRGTAPLLVALTSVLLLGESLSAKAWVGVGLICVGILSMAPRRPSGGRGMSVALLNAFVIAGYTLIDGAGVRRSGAPEAYTLWIFLLTGLPLAAWIGVRRRTTIIGYIGRNWHLGLAGGAGSLVSYGLVLWAMTTAPVAVVAALRETAILFGIAISGLMLGERIGFRRIIAACLIACGAVALRLT